MNFQKITSLSHISKETYFRLDAVNLLPDSIERFLYLDSDIIVLGNLSEFYHQPFGDKLIVASPDYLSRGEEHPALTELKKIILILLTAIYTLMPE